MFEYLISRGNRRRIAGAVALVACALLAAGCAGTRGGSIPYDVKSFGPPDAPAGAALAADYRIAPMDTVTVNVFQVQALSRDYQVDLTGHIAMPLVGNVPVVGLTTTEAQQRLAQRLGERYLNNPDVTVGIAASTQRVVTIDGAVYRPGAHPITGPMTLMQAVALGGGAREDANPRRIAIFRHVSGQRMAAAFDLTRIRRGQDPDPPVYRGDIIVVDGSSIQRIQRQILQALPIIGIFNPLL